MKNLKHVYFLIAIFSVVFLSEGAESISAQDKCNTYSAPSLGVTLCAPQDWTIENKPDVEQKSSDQSVGTIIITKQNNAPASFVGRIVDADGRAVNGALVITSGIEGNPNIFYRRTNPSGYFRIIDLPSGSYAATIKIKRRVIGARLVVVNEQLGSRRQRL